MTHNCGPVAPSANRFLSIRPQYHFRPSPDGLRAWDVRKLIEAARDLEVVNLPLAEITELDEAYWYDLPPPPTTRSIAEHARLINEADLRYPIILCADGRLMDGMHRVAKAHLEGAATIKAVRFEVTPDPDHVGKSPEELPYDP